MLFQLDVDLRCLDAAWPDNTDELDTAGPDEWDELWLWDVLWNCISQNIEKIKKITNWVPKSSSGTSFTALAGPISEEVLETVALQATQKDYFWNFINCYFIHILFI